MYLALRWLLGMVLTMWIGLCLIDYYWKAEDIAYIQFMKFNELNDFMAPLLKNSSILVKQNSLQKPEKIVHLVHHNNVFYSRYYTFIAGTCLVLMYYRKNDFILYTRIKLKSIKKYDLQTYLLNFKTLQNTAIANLIRVAILRMLKMSKGMFKKLGIILLTLYKRQIMRPERYSQNVNLHLLNKLKEYSRERKKLDQFLFAAIQENRNMKTQYQLEMLAKKRLIRYIEDTQKQIKENKSQYLSFQKLYLTTHQENNFLKLRVGQLTRDKEDAERNLIKLVNYVWQSKNTELKEYCTRFIVRTKNNLLNSDVRKEIDQFLTKPTKPKYFYHESFKKSHLVNSINEVNEIFHEDISSLVKDAPKLRGLPGECVWTVKDKDGLIEKLYEYETNFDNGDTIRRIRQYSVYYDKDCLLDVSGSTTLIQRTNFDLTNFCYEYMNKRITGSRAFQIFLENNNIIAFPRTSPALIY